MHDSLDAVPAEGDKAALVRHEVDQAACSGSSSPGWSARSGQTAAVTQTSTAVCEEKEKVEVEALPSALLGGIDRDGPDVGKWYRVRSRRSRGRLLRREIISQDSSGAGTFEEGLLQRMPRLMSVSAGRPTRAVSREGRTYKEWQRRRC